MRIIKKQLRRLTFAFSGILYAVRNDASFKSQWYVGIPVMVLLLFMLWPVTKIEFLLLAGAYCLILITELQNSALEAALDHLHPELHHNIGKSKDMAAGAVLLAGFFLLCVVVTLFAGRL